MARSSGERRAERERAAGGGGIAEESRRKQESNPAAVACEHPVFETGVATNGHLILQRRFRRMRRGPPTGDYDRALDDEKMANMMRIPV